MTMTTIHQRPTARVQTDFAAIAAALFHLMKDALTRGFSSMTHVATRRVSVDGLNPHLLADAGLERSTRAEHNAQLRHRALDPETRRH